MNFWKVNKMMIITINRKKAKIYSTTKDNHKSVMLYGNFSISYKNEQIQISNIKIKKSNKNQQIDDKELIKILKDNELYLASKHGGFKKFLKQNDINFSFKKVCHNCLERNMITPIIANSSYRYAKNILCQKCAVNELNSLAYTNDYGKNAVEHFTKILLDTKDLSFVTDLMFNKIDLLDHNYALYDKIDSNEPDFAKITIDEVDIPGVFKTILKRKIDYLLPVQILALNAGLLYDEDLLVVSQTASGKTLIAELAGITKALQNKKFVYLSPLVALANQKYRYFKESYSSLGLNVVIKVGKNKINAQDELKIIEKPVEDADIIVATYEGLDFILRSGSYDSLNDLGVVVIDEIHMLENYDRGSRLQGLINRLMTLYPQAQLIGLSATINNPDELAERFNMSLVEYDKRPVSLERHIMAVENNHQKLQIISQLCKNEFDKISSLGYRGQTIIFTDSRRKTNQIANGLKKHNVSAQSYHAGLTYQNKVDIELRYANQKISTVVTTAALAAGVDFPASLVIFDSLRMGKDWLTANEFHQMMGRAGRPSYHDIGKVYLFYGLGKYYKHSSEEEMAYSLLESTVSDIKVKYSTDDIYEQILADISSFTHIKRDILEKRYYTMDSELLFNQVTDELADMNMIIYDSVNDSFNITDYGRAVSKSFLKIREAELIKTNITGNLLDTVTNLEYLTNVYLSNNYLRLFKEYTYYVSARLFADSNKEMIFNPYFVYSLPNKEEKMLVRLILDFKGNCEDICCDCLEINISKYIIQRRIDSLTPLDISKEFREKYAIVIYSGDIYNYLDQVIRYLEAIERIALVFDVISVKNECRKLIRLIEG